MIPSGWKKTSDYSIGKDSVSVVATRVNGVRRWEVFDGNRLLEWFDGFDDAVNFGEAQCVQRTAK